MNQEKRIKQKFDRYIYDSTLKHMLLIISLGVLFLLYYMYSDLKIRNSIQAFYARFIPIIIGVPLFIFHLISKDRFKHFKVVLYHLFLTSGVVMMYIISLIHLNTNALAPSVTGIILLIFIISLEIKTKTLNTIFIYFLPLLLFSLSLIFYFKPTSEEFTVMADIYPIIFAGFAINRIQYNLRYKLFKSNYLLDIEKQKSEELYKETLLINADLQRKTDEILAHKEEIVEKNEKLQESNATKDKFFAIISHDLLGPFNILMGFSDLLKDSFGKEELEEQKKYVNYIHQHITKTHKLLENLLRWARSQKNSLEFKLEKENLYLFAEEIIELIKQAANKKSIEISNHINQDISVYADKNMLATILRNLISNAIKFTPTSGMVSLHANFLNHDPEKKWVEISVKDTGVGLKPEIKEKLFNTSKNITTKGTENEEGSGLGLILCKEFIEKHGGNIRIESEPEKGSSFIFTLPATYPANFYRNNNLI